MVGVPGIYVDGIMEVGFENGVIKIGMGSLSAPKGNGPEDNPVRHAQVTSRVVMAPQTMFTLMKELKTLADTLVENGTLKFQDANESTDNSNVIAKVDEAQESFLV